MDIGCGRTKQKHNIDYQAKEDPIGSSFAYKLIRWFYKLAIDNIGCTRESIQVNLMLSRVQPIFNKVKCSLPYVKREPYYLTFLTVGDLSFGSTDRSCFVCKAGRQKAEGGPVLWNCARLTRNTMSDATAQQFLHFPLLQSFRNDVRHISLRGRGQLVL